MPIKVIGEEETLDKVLQGASIARYGDGELNLCEGKKCVPQLLVPGIPEELRRILASKDAQCLVGIPYVDPRMPPEKQASWRHYMPRFAPFLRDGKQYHSAFISRPDSAPWVATPEYFEKVRSLWQGKDVALVWGGYRSLYPEFLRRTGANNVRSVLCSYEDAYSQIDSLEAQVVATGAKRVLLCAGPTATCLAYRLALRGIHAVDLGHVALFWQYAGGEEAIKIAPVTVLPPVNATKAQIKAYGEVDDNRIAGLWWPRVDPEPGKTYDQQVQIARQLDTHGPFEAKVAVFVGAGAGPALAALRQVARVYAFEPDFGMFGALRRNLHKTGAVNVAFYKEAVGDVVGQVRMLPGQTAGQWKVDNEKGVASVMQTTIDACELDACDLIVTNVDDYHDKVIAGAKQTIEKFNPRIVRL